MWGILRFKGEDLSNVLPLLPIKGEDGKMKMERLKDGDGKMEMERWEDGKMGRWRWED